MSDVVDEFCFTNPINQRKGRWNRLLPLSHSDPVFSQLEQQFNDGWRHPNKERPSVRTIFKILFSEESLQPYLGYRERVTGSSLFSLFWKADPNEQLLFHGTTRACLLGEDANSVYLCDIPDCLLCNVLRDSFDVDKCGNKNKFKRFGAGIYVSACSSKADDYSKNLSRKSALRVMLINRVVVGKPFKRLYNATYMKEPPAGYDSVVGEPGADLNYEETVLYTNDAIRPAYLIVYGDKPTTQSKIQSVVKKLFNTPLAT